MDRRWRIPAVISGLTNIGLVVLLGVLGHIQTPIPESDEIVEVQLVHEDKGSAGQPSAGPAITAPHTEKREIPPPITNLADAEAILEQVKVEAPKNVAIVAPPSALPENPGGGGEGTGPSNGNGDSNGDGDGQGAGDGNGGGGNDDGVIVDAGSLSLVSDVEAPYPPKMLRQGKTGTVVVQLVVEKDGSVSSVDIIGGSGQPEFERAVMQVAYQWTFVPATRNGRPVRAYATRTYRFAL
ncbi:MULTISPECIES: energy transducer TonB [unclassified Veillonella]|uniref:energy transducer TonB n=1 Tax=unclassified Veillonella TaxID=2630086 RepID=UPI00021A2813|nr:MULTISPECIES: energy transducer TonB [unclassified Veillonella]EGS33394.1 TonB-dependent receptor [Veillonella sp. oral taxon 780 str. F0422]